VLRNNAPRSRESRSWAGRFTEQRWAIESAGGLGYFLAQLNCRLRGRHHVPPTLSAHAPRARLAEVAENPNDALSNGVAALRHRRLHAVVADDHAVTLRMLADRWAPSSRYVP
jgi:hypothetical protein